MTRRVAGLIYTSADAAGAHGGGFKVTSSRGDLTEAELAELAAYRPGAAGLEEDGLPQFATPEEVAAGPRALDYRTVLDGAAWWNVTPAGSDATGRGSNQVMHVAFASGVATHRPVERWRSPDWRTPFGRDEVAAATLTSADLPRAHPDLGREAVLGSLAHERSGDLELVLVLLDQVVDALERGADTVLLVVPDADAAAWWLAAVTHLLPRGRAGRVTFSILADGAPGPLALVETLRRDGILVGCVASGSVDLGGLPDGVTVVDTAGPVLLGLAGERHEVAGRSLVSGEMSSLVLELLVEPEHAIEAMAWIDAALDPIVEPRWALAAALLRHPDRFADAAAGAGRTVVTRAPAAIATELDDVARRALASHLDGASAEATWKAYADLGANNVFRSRAAGVYVTRALADASWLGQEKPLAYPTTPVELPADLDAVAALHDLRERLEKQDDDGSRRALLNAVALLVAVGDAFPEALAPKVGEAVGDALEAVLTPLLAPVGPEAWWTLTTSWPLPPILRPAVGEMAAAMLDSRGEMGSRPLGERLDARLTRWIAPDALDRLRTGFAPSRIEAEAIVGNAEGLAPRSTELCLALGVALADHEAGGPPARVLDRFDELSADDAANVLANHIDSRTGWLSDRQLIVFLLESPWTEAIRELCAIYEVPRYEGSAPTAVQAAARVRTISRDLPWTPAHAGRDVGGAVDDILHVAPEAIARADDHVLGLMQVFHARAEIENPGSGREFGARQAEHRVLRPEASEAVQAGLMSTVGDQKLLAAHVRVSCRLPRAPRIDITVLQDGVKHPLLEVLARRVLADADDAGALMRAAESHFHYGEIEHVQSALGPLAPRGPRLAHGLRSLLGRTRPDVDEER